MIKHICHSLRWFTFGINHFISWFKCIFHPNLRLLASLISLTFTYETCIYPSFQHKFGSILWKPLNHIFFRDISTSEDVVCWSDKADFCCSRLISETKTHESCSSVQLSLSPGSGLLFLSSGPIMQRVLSDWTTYCFSSQYPFVRDCVPKCVCM